MGLTDIYHIQNKLNGKAYVGQAKQMSMCGNKPRGYLTRWSEHKAKAAFDASCAIHSAMAKHGIEHFSIEKIVTVEEELADDYETMFIDLYNTGVPAGYNISPGGSGTGTVHSLQTRLKMSKGRRPLSDLPMNIYHLHTKCSEGYTVNQYGHHRATFSSSKHSMEEKLEQAKAYLATMPKEKPKRELPRYVCRYQGGLLVYFKQTASRPKVWKAFRTGTHAEQLAAVQKFLETLKQKGVIE